jgi:DNA-binding transcriptional LysR family regulator
MNTSKPPLPLTRMNIRQIVLLAHLDRESSVLRAANAAGMSQPAASTLLRELEADMGVPLFERHARGVERTAYGEIVVRSAITVLTEIQRAQDAVTALKRGESYRVAIGSVMSPGTDLLPRALTILERRQPQMVVSVEIDNSRILVNKLLEGRLDFVIARVFDPERAADLVVESLSEESHSLICRSGHPLTRKRKLSLDDLNSYTWIFPPTDSILRERITSMFIQRGLQLPAKIIETSSVPVTTRLLQSSDMLVALPEVVVKPYCEVGLLRVLPVELNVRLDAFGIITRRDHTLSKDANIALKAIREVAKTLYPVLPADIV